MDALSTQSPRRLRSFAPELALAVAYAVCGVFTALLASKRCAGDGSFSLDDSDAKISGYCKLTHFPGVPDSAASALLVGLIYLGPTLLLLAATAATFHRPGHVAKSAVAAAGAVWLLLDFVLTLLSHVSYTGSV